MPDLRFQISGVKPASRGIAPLLHFTLEITSEPQTGSIHGLLLSAQVQIQAPQRAYDPGEKEKLVDLFGAPEQWGQTLRNRLWTQTQATVNAFQGRAQVILPVPCTYDFNIAAAKYFYALETGEVPLLFLFSGTVFYAAPDGRLQVQPVSWDKECAFSMPVPVWRDLMEHHYPDSAWIYLQRDVFERLYAFKRNEGLATWEQTIERLLREKEEPTPCLAP